MKIQFSGWLTVACIVLATLSSTAVSQTSNVKSSATQVANSKGKNLFESSCAVCHGLDGGGGEHAPKISRTSAAKSKSDSALASILRDGIPSKGMPPFASLGAPKLQSILSYLRFLQGKNETRTDTGNPAQGKQIFFGKGGCADCHAMHGEGHYLSTDLSDFAYDHDPADILTAIIKPQEQVPHTSARVTTNSGQQFSGVIRNESNSSLQMQGPGGEFYLFMKSEVQSMERSPAPSMPADYQQKLSSSETKDLVSYIVHQSPSSQAVVSQPVGHKKKNQME